MKHNSKRIAKMPNNQSPLVSDAFETDLGCVALFHSEQDIRYAAAALNWRVVEFNRKNRKENNAED